MGRTSCTEPQCLYSTAIPLLPLLAVQPVQNFSVCTVQLNLYSPYGPYCLYRASVPVQYSYTSTPPTDRTACTEPQCLYSTAIPLLPYGPYGLYRATVPVQYSYTSTPPMGRTACTEPQCLYGTAIPLLPLLAVRPVQSLSACTRVHFNLQNSSIFSCSAFLIAFSAWYNYWRLLYYFWYLSPFLVRASFHRFSQHLL